MGCIDRSLVTSPCRARFCAWYVIQKRSGWKEMGISATRTNKPSASKMTIILLKEGLSSFAERNGAEESFLMLFMIAYGFSTRQPMSL